MITKGLNNIVNVYKGSQKLSKVMLGSDQVWPSGGTLSLVPSSINLNTPASTTEQILVSSDTNWQITLISSWISASPTSGFGNTYVTLTIGENPNIQTHREGVVRFETIGIVPTITKELDISQAGKAFLSPKLKTRLTKQQTCLAPNGTLDHYIDTQFFTSATKLWTDENRSTFAPDGWYMQNSGGVVRHWLNNEFVADESC